MDYTTVVNAVSNVNGSSFIGLDTVTVPTLKGGKKNPHQGRVTKRVIGSSVMVFQNKNTNGYENMIRRRLLNEGKNPDSFELSERKWGTRLENLPIVKHDKDAITKHYLEVIFLKAGKVEYLLDGSPVQKDSIIGLEESAEGEQGGLDNKVVIRTFEVNSIVRLRVDGAEYR